MQQYQFDVEKQAESYSSISTFETALGSISDSSFVMSAPEENYGFVYNILLPFSAWQSEQYAAEKTKGYNESQLYAKRANILNGIVGKDLRGSWISEHDHANYSYKDGENYFFFENQTGANANGGDAQKLKYLTKARQVRKIIEEMAPDIINVHYATSYGAVAALAGIKKYILSVSKLINVSGAHQSNTSLYPIFLCHGSPEV